MGNITISNDYTDLGDENIPLGITVKAFTTLSSISGMGKAEIEARELIDVDNRSIKYFFIASTTSSGQYPQEGRAVIDYDEIERTCLAIDRLKLSHPGVTKFINFEVEYKTSDNFKIIVFSQSRGGLGVSISAGNVSMFLNDIRKLDEIKSAFEKGKAYIDSNRLPGTY